jgi:Sulfotransferase domain
MPTYLIVGAMKGGTSAMYEYLVRHPSVGRAMVEEVHFFSYNFSKGLRWYRGHFPTIIQQRTVKLRRHVDLITGESTPYYMFHPHAPARIASILPDAKLIVLLRNPVDRAYAHYQHSRQMGVDPIQSFEEALDVETARLAPELEKMLTDPSYESLALLRFSYLSRGMYADQLARLFGLFRRDQILVENAEEFMSDPETVYLRALRFLGLPEHRLGEYPRYNLRRSRYGPMAPETRARLMEHFIEPNQRLYELLGTRYDWDR